MATTAAGLQVAGRYKNKNAAKGTGTTTHYSRCIGNTQNGEMTKCEAAMVEQERYETSSWRSLERDQGT